MWLPDPCSVFRGCSLARVGLLVAGQSKLHLLLPFPIALFAFSPLRLFSLSRFLAFSLCSPYLHGCGRFRDKGGQGELDRGGKHGGHVAVPAGDRPTGVDFGGLGLSGLKAGTAIKTDY